MAEKSKQSSELAELKKQCEGCCKELAALKKEVAALKKAKSSGGADPRVEKLIEALKIYGVDYQKAASILEKLK